MCILDGEHQFFGARILDDEEKGVKLTETEAKEQWHLRCKNMDDIINRGEKTVIAGAIRDFHLNPAKYIGRDEATNRIEDAFADFLHVQWANLEAINIREEKRHITEDEELSTIRVVDNTEDVFIGACQYVGMMKGKAAIKRGQNDACISSAEREQARRDVNSCKMVKFEDFCKLMEGQEEFQLLDAAQALLNKMDDEQWTELYDKAEGIVKENYRKTFIMRWNTDISNYKLSEFEDAMEDFFDEGFYYDWSIWDYQKAHIGDRFYIHPERTPLLLTTDELTEAIPDFNWKEGHSGEMLNDTQSAKLEEVWADYIERTHAISSEEVER